MKNKDKISTIVNKTLVWVVVMMLSISTLSAQTDLPDAPVDEPAAPIDGYVWVLATIGLVYVYLRVRAIAKQGNSQSK
jgi:uncharacterized membrane protein YagU involved in acid resistance